MYHMEHDPELFFQWHPRQQIPVAKIEARYLSICDKNICTSVLLDKFYDFSWWANERTKCDFDGNYHDPAIYNTVEGIAEWFLGLFEFDEIERSIAYLQDRDYIKVTYQQEAVLKIACNLSQVQEDVEECEFKSIRIHTMEYCLEQSRRQEEEQRNYHPVTVAEIEKIETTSKEEQKVRYHNKRAAKANLPATLTLEEWIATLDYFEWKCAYCKGKYSLLEHFIPLNHGVGTTKENCVPACGSCNTIKQAWNPLSEWGPDMKKIREGINRVQTYLAS
jgi:5-methylcytosine-specific restriction endonuclease McrA